MLLNYAILNAILFTADEVSDYHIKFLFNGFRICEGAFGLSF